MAELTTTQMVWAAIVRWGRILIAQAIAWVMATYGGWPLPWIPLTLGAVISGVCKYLRDKYGWDWLPV
jgi:hypothetical protein